MSSLADLPDLVGFFSYSRSDDEHSDGALSLFRERISKELRLQLGRKLRLWQDKEAIPFGTLWADEIMKAIGESVFFIPIVSPSAVNSDYCRMEFEAFLAREAKLGRSDLVFPILYIRVPQLRDEHDRRHDVVLNIIHARQYADWTKIRLEDATSAEVGRHIARFCEHIVEALHKAPGSREEGRNKEAETRRLVEAERQRIAYEEHRRDAEARPLKEQEEVRRFAEEKAAKLAVLPERRRQAEADARQSTAQQKDMEQRSKKDRSFRVPAFILRAVIGFSILLVISAVIARWANVASVADCTRADGRCGDAARASADDGSPSGASPRSQLHFVIRPAAATPPGWTSEGLAKRLVSLLASTESKFFMRMRDGVEVHSSLAPELTKAGDAVVVWSGDNPQGSPEFIFRGVEGLELLPWTQSAETQPTSSSLAIPRIRATDYISFAEFKIATPFLYDQWQVGIEVVTKVYGREQPYTFDDPCRYSLTIPRTGWLSALTGPLSISLESTEQAGKSILLSRQPVKPAQLMRALDEPLRLDVHSTNASPSCVSQTTNLAAFATAAGNAGTAWKVSGLPGTPYTGRMEIRTASLMTQGRWLLSLYGLQNVGTGTEGGSRDAADLQDRIVNSLTAFLDDFRERHFQDSQPASAAVGADLALISAADAVSPNFSEKNVVTGKFRQPPSQNGLFRLDPEGSRRLSAFLSSPGNIGAEVSIGAVSRMIRYYSDLFGNFSGQRPPIAIFVGTARPVAGTCPEWKKMTAEIAKLPGRPRVFGIVFANTTTDEIAQQLGHNGQGAGEILDTQTRVPTCDGDSGSALLFIPFPDLISRTPEAVLWPAFDVVERWAAKLEN